MIGQLQRMAKPATRTEVSLRIGMKTQQLIDECFTGSHTPDGTPWLPVRRGGAPLRVTDRLRNSSSLTSKASGYSIIFALIYAAVQNYGRGAVHARQFMPDPQRLPPEWRAAFKDEARAVRVEVMGR